MAEQPDINSDHLIKVGRFFFDNFCESHNVRESMRTRVNPMMFYNWFVTQITSYTPEHLAESQDVTLDTAQYWMGLADRADGVNAMMGVWSHMTLGHRKQKHALRSANLMLVLTYDDGVVVPLSIFAHKETTDSVLDDANVALMVASRVQGLAQMIADNSLDTIHDAHAHMVGLADPDLLKLLQRMTDTFMKDNPAGQKIMGVVINQIATMFPSELPPALKAQLDAAKVQGNDSFNEKSTEPQATGGWNN